MFHVEHSVSFSPPLDDLDEARVSSPSCTQVTIAKERRIAAMSKIIAISNQKGGVGKTTTAVNLSASLAVAEKRTLLIDLDPQGNASSGVGVKPNEKTSYEMMLGNEDASACIQSTKIQYLDVMPTDRRLAGAEVELVNQDERENFLKKAAGSLRDRYDFVVIDTPPSLGLLTLNALTAADSVLIPIQCEYYALEGLSQLLSTVQFVQRGLNPSLRLEGVLLTMWDGRLKLSRQVAEEAIDFFGETVYQAKIPRNVRLSEAPSFGKPILLYDVDCVGSRSYLDLAKEVIAKNS
ncbi:MAG: chromosome partitioning protein [Candidatus Krumholzibacteriia bacterium]|jgi:chromosome partitioning protein